MAERSKAPDSRLITFPAYNGSGRSGLRMEAWVRIPLLTICVILFTHFTFFLVYYYYFYLSIYLFVRDCVGHTVIRREIENNASANIFWSKILGEVEMANGGQLEINGIETINLRYSIEGQRVKKKMVFQHGP